MGGPTSVRGFNLNSLGPRDQEDSLGGDLALEAGASISFPFTSGTSSILRGHLFSNIGWLGSSNSAPFIKDNLKTFFVASPPSVSLGGGLLFRLSPSARLELNLTYPILGDPHTKAPHKGLQLGLGIEFL
jgi:outer membrane protein insertion porin family